MSQTSPCWAFGDDVQSFEYYTQQILEALPQKIVIGGLMSALCSFFYADYIIMWTLIIAVLSDFVLGVILGIRTDHSLDWAKMKRGGLKFVSCALHILIVASGGMVLNRTFHTDFPYLNVYLSISVLTELKSVARNMGALGITPPPAFAWAMQLLYKNFRMQTKELKGEEKKDASGTPPDRDI